MAKPFADIQTDAEYLRAVGFKVNIYRDDVYLDVRRPGDGSSWCHEVKVSDLGLHDTDPSRKWENLANVLRVLGPEMDRRGWLMWRKDHKNYSDVTLFDKHGAMPGNGCAALPHLALLKAFYTAHAQGETG